MPRLSSRPEKDAAPGLNYLMHVVDPVDPDTQAPKSFRMTIKNMRKRIHGAGWFDYNDEDTILNPIAVTEATSPVKLTNDELGAFTNKTYAPLDIADVWDASINEFDWSELVLGDMVDIRGDVEITTTQPNQAIELSLRLGVGAGEYTIPFVINEYKAAGVKRVIAYRGIYMGDANTIENGAHFEVSSDDDCSVKVNGWYCKVTRI